MLLEIHYGDGKIPLDIPEKNLARFIKAESPEASDEIKAVLDRAMENPTGLKLEELAKGKRVVVLIEDGTRSEPHQEIIEAFASRLGEAREVVFFVATGSHDPTEERTAKIGNYIRESIARNNLKSASVFIHDCFKSEFESVGKTGSGTEVLINKPALGAELYVVGADMKPHYFAGYCNGLKDFLPGISAFKTIEMNHSLALHSQSSFCLHPFHPDEDKRNNPLAQDMLEAVKIITQGAEIFALSTIVYEKKIVWASSGEIEKVTAEGIKKIDELVNIAVEPERYMIVSPGGFPEDESLYTAQRGLELTKNAVIDGGEILFLAECKNGIAPNEEAQTYFYSELKKPIDEVLEGIKKKYHLYQHKAYKFAEMLKKLNRVWFYSGLTPEEIREIHLEPVENAQSVINDWVEKNPEAKIYVFDIANELAITKK